MKSSKPSPSPFEIPNIKNAKVVKTEIKTFLNNIVYNYTKPLSFENEPYSLETTPLIRGHLDTYLSILDIDLQLFLQNIQLFRSLSLNKKLLQAKHIEEQLTQLISKFIFKTFFTLFLNQVREFNLSLENPKYSSNALQEIERYIHNFEVEDVERIVISPDNPHHWLQTDIIQKQSFLYHYLKDITLNEQSISQIKLISLFLRKFFRFNHHLIWSEKDQVAFTAFIVYHSS